MNFFAVVLIGLFVIGALAAIAGIVALVVVRSRDHRTKDERLADEYGDMEPGTMKITPGNGFNQVGGIGR